MTLSTRFAALDPREYALPDGLADRLLTPALVVHLDRVRENVRRVIALAGGDPDRWRPHVKTTKIPEVFAALADAGVRHFKCATTRELAWLLHTLETRGAGGADVLLAHPLGGPGLARLVDLARGHPAARISLLAEDPQAAAGLPPALGVFVDVNPGMDRTGIPAADEAAILAVAAAAGARFRGLHWYEGQLRDPDLAARRRAACAGYERLLAIAARLRAAGTPAAELVTSGTPTFLAALAYAPFRALAGVRHRVSPGTVVFHDLLSEQENPDLDLLPAALVAARVVSHPAPGLATCDAGAKSIAAEAGDPGAFVLGHPELAAQRPSEEHLPLWSSTGERPARGDLLFLVPRHVCPTVDLHEQAVLLDGGALAGIVPVRARAHDLLARP
ncbi:MAG: alanine racemase [Planctomycetota bacterium]